MKNLRASPVQLKPASRLSLLVVLHALFSLALNLRYGILFLFFKFRFTHGRQPFILVKQILWLFVMINIVQKSRRMPGILTLLMSTLIQTWFCKTVVMNESWIGSFIDLENANFQQIIELADALENIYSILLAYYDIRNYNWNQFEIYPWNINKEFQHKAILIALAELMTFLEVRHSYHWNRCVRNRLIIYYSEH